MTSTTTDLAPSGAGDDDPGAGAAAGSGTGASEGQGDVVDGAPVGRDEPPVHRLRFARWMRCIAFGGLVVRLIYLLGWKDTGVAWSDSFYYHEGANLLADGRGYIHPFQWIYHGFTIPGADHPPGYLTVLSAFSALGFRSFLAHQLISCVIGALGVLAMGWTARRVAGERVGLLAGLIVALSPNVWFHDALVMSESLVVATTAGVLWAAYRWWDRLGLLDAALFGALVGIAALVRSEALLLGPFIAVPLLWWRRHELVTRVAGPAVATDADGDGDGDGEAVAGDAEAGERVAGEGEADERVAGVGGRRTDLAALSRQLVIAGGVAALVVAPWIVHNMVRFEHPVTLSAQFDHTLVSANCDEVFYGPNTGYWSRNCVEAVEGLTDPRNDASEEGVVYRRLARDYVGEHTGRAAVVAAARVGRTFGLYEPENQVDLDLLSDGKEKGLGQAGLLSWYVVAVAGAFGIVGLRRAGRPIFPIVAVVAATTLTVIVTYGATRFRFPAELALCIPAAVALDAAIGAFTASRHRRREAVPVEPAPDSGPIAPQTGAGTSEDDGEDGEDGEPAVEVPAGRASASIKFAGLDGLRAIAALGVLACHVALASGQVVRTGGQYLARADAGVALFFMLSGFLLYRPFVSARLDGKDAPEARRYLRHRFLRIFPAFWLALTVLTVVLDVRQRADIRTPWDFVMYYGLLQSYSKVTALGGLQQAWTLTNELAFYLLLPVWAFAAAWLFRRLRGRRAVLAEGVVLALAAAGALAFRTWVESLGGNSLEGHTFFDEFFTDPRLHWIIGNFHMFVPGMALALAYEWSRRRDRPLAVLELIRRHALVCWAVAGVAFWYVSTQIGLDELGSDSAREAFEKEVLYAVVGFALLAPVALAGETLPRSLRWLGTRVMVTLGVLSYGIYLWHEGVTDVYRDTRDIQAPDGTYLLSGWFPAMLAFCVVGSIALAAVSYWLVERPALLLKDRDRKLFAEWRPVGLPVDRRHPPRIPAPSPAPAGGAPA